MKILKNSTRRQFVKAAGVAAAGVTAACSPIVVPRHVLGGPGYTAPSDKLHLASIGCGGKGWSDIKNAENNGAAYVVALCDIDSNMAKNARKAWPRAKFYNDFRVMLAENKDIDGVTISTPDHTHAVASMAAMEQGAAVYLQKPLTHNIKEARLLTEAARKYKVVSQMGNQGASSPDQQQMIEWFDKGLIGTVSEVHVWTNRPVWPQGLALPKNSPSRPSHITRKDWDLFIGPARYQEYDPLFHPFKWRGWWNFGTGALGDMGCHLIDPPFRVLGLGYPTEVECSVGQIYVEDWVPQYLPQSCPPSASVQLKFPASAKNSSAVTLNWSAGGIRPFHPELIPASHAIGMPDSSNGVIMMGDKGIMTCGTYGLDPKVYLNNGDVLTMPEGYDGGNSYALGELPEYGHHVAWADAIKAGYDSSQHKALTSSFDYSGPLTEAVLMGNLAIRSYQQGAGRAGTKLDFPGRKRLLWDGEDMRITNYDAANQYVSRPYRRGWEL